jgi:hypothetical protein
MIMKPLALGLMLLAGCAAAPAGPDSPWYAYPPQTLLTQRQPIPIEPDAASARLQFGRVAARNAVQEMEPYCVLEVATVSAAARTLAPASYKVARVTRQTSVIAAAPALALNDGSGSISHLYYQTVFRLEPNPAGASYLTCMHNQPPGSHGGYQRHLTLAEIRAALGGLMSLDTPDAHGGRDAPHHETRASVVGRQSFADTARHDGGKGFPPYRLPT